MKEGLHDFLCCAIISVETDMRWESGQNVATKAQAILNTLKPKHIRDNMKETQPWWPKGSQERFDALEEAIKIAIKRND